MTTKQNYLWKLYNSGISSVTPYLDPENNQHSGPKSRGQNIGKAIWEKGKEERGEKKERKALSFLFLSTPSSFSISQAPSPQPQRHPSKYLPDWLTIGFKYIPKNDDKNYNNFFDKY
jgi:hypothetical protein